MSVREELALNILCELDLAVLERLGPEEYAFFGTVPDFYVELFPPQEGEPCLAPWEHSAMLEFFLHDAELFFERREEGRLLSGIWQETGLSGKDMAVAAVALNTRDTCFIILRKVHEEHVDRARILQKARESLLERRRLHSDLVEYKQRARYDALTTLYNKASFHELLAEEVARTRESGAGLSLLFLDIDDFKRINDTYGHLAGDAVLTALGRFLRACLRREDMPCRYGGEEFAVIAPHTLQHQAVRLAEKLRKRIARHCFGPLPPITISIGCSCCQPGDSADDLLQRADLALYDAKRNGKNTVCCR